MVERRGANPRTLAEKSPFLRLCARSSRSLGMTEEPLSESSQGDFFAVDRRSWAAACGLGMNAAVAYVVLARFSQRDNRTTAASVHAVETYTGIARGRSRMAIDALIQGRLVRQLRDGTRPLYELVPFADVREAMSDRERALYERLAAGEQARNDMERSLVSGLMKKGWLRYEVGGSVSRIGDAEPEWIWLPNALATGAAAEPSPVDRVRQTQDVMALRLLVDLYSAQNLREDGGVDRRIVWRQQERTRVGARGDYTVWGFQGTTQSWVNWGSPVSGIHRREPSAEEKAANKNANAGGDFFARLQQLQRLHLIDWVPYVFEGEDAAAEPMFPCGRGQGEGVEDKVGLAAYRAGAALLTSDQLTWAQGQGLWLVPLLAHIDRAQMFEIARLRYRPHTKLTAAWYGELRSTAERWLETFAAIAPGTAPPARAAG
jgi:hypothetical protein